jgi:hypothetical protein
VVGIAEANTLCGRSGREDPGNHTGFVQVPLSARRQGAPAWHAALVPDAGDQHDAQAKLARVAWSITASVCLLVAVILGINRFYGYAGVSLAVAIAAGINILP